MIKSKAIIFLLFVSLIFVSCPAPIPDWMSEDGQEICNYPEWTTECNAFSLWMDWQSDDGERLHDLVDNTIIPDDFTGKFRIGICGQNITIGFNNKNGDCVRLRNWYGEVTNWQDSTVSIEQKNPDTYIYDCYCKKEKSESATAENKAAVEMTKIDGKSFHYKQTVAEKTVIACTFYNLNYFCEKNSTYTKAADIPVKLSDYFPVEYKTDGDSFLYFYPVDGSSSYKKIATSPSTLFRYIYCPEGVAFREINEEKNKISFNLLDSAESDYIDYFEIQVNSKDNVSISFYKMTDDVPLLLKTLAKPDLHFVWLPDSETGETKTY